MKRLALAIICLALGGCVTLHKGEVIDHTAPYWQETRWHE